MCAGLFLRRYAGNSENLAWKNLTLRLTRAFLRNDAGLKSIFSEFDDFFSRCRIRGLATNRHVSINLPCSIRHVPRVLSPSSGGSRTQVPSARYIVWCRGPCHVPTNNRVKVASSGRARAMTGTRKAATKMTLGIKTNLLDSAVMSTAADSSCGELSEAKHL